MDTTTQILLAFGIIALVALAFFAVFRGRGKLDLKGPGVRLKAEGENPPPPAAIPAGVNVEKAKAGRDLLAHSASEGGVSAQGAEAKGSLKATHQPGEPPPK